MLLVSIYLGCFLKTNLPAGSIHVSVPLLTCSSGTFPHLKVFWCVSYLCRKQKEIKEETCSCSTTSSSLFLTKSVFKKNLFFNHPWCWHDLSLGVKWGETRRSSEHLTRTWELSVEHKAASSSTLRTISHPGSSDWRTHSPARVWIDWWRSDGLRAVTANECLQLKR